MQNCNCKNPQHLHFDTQLGGFIQPDQDPFYHLGNLSLIDALKDPTGTIDIYKKQAIEVVTQGALVFAGALLLGNYLMLHQILNQKIKKIRR